MTPPIRTRRLAMAVAATVTAVVALSACSNSSGSKTVKLVAYSVPKPAYDSLAKAFAKTSKGKGVQVKGSYGPSGSQSKAVLGGQRADYVGFSVEPDLTKLVPSKVDKGWNSGATKGLVSDSVVVIVVRKGNPLHITGWDDLIKPGVKIVTPDPASSGSAKWNILAAYQQVIANGGTEADAQTYLKSFFHNVVSKPTSGATAMTTFLQGTGDVVISYEAEAILARAAGNSLDYIVPQQTMLIETPAAVTVGASQPAKDFLSFALSTQGQQLFAASGFRPALAGVTPGTVKGANDPSHPFPTVAKLVTIASLGGWTAVNDKYFDPTNGIVTKIEGGSG